MRLIIFTLSIFIFSSGFSQKNDIFELFYDLPLNAKYEEILNNAWENHRLIPNMPIFKGNEQRQKNKFESYKNQYFSGKVNEPNINGIKCDSSDIIISTGERYYNEVKQASMAIHILHWLNKNEDGATKVYEFLYEYLSKFNKKPIFKEVDYGEGKSKGRMFTYKHFMADGFYIVEVQLLYNDKFGHYLSIMYWRPK